MLARMDSQPEKTNACQGKIETTDLEASPEEIESEVEHEVPKAEATMKPVRALKKQHGDCNLAVGHCQKPKKQTQGNDESQKKLATACRGMTHIAIPAWHKGQGNIKNPERMDVWEETSVKTGMQQWQEEYRLKGVAMSWK
jgi:hypothetical protein